ncbi:MAG: TIGR00269 family protein [Thermoprotei archaeon]
MKSYNMFARGDRVLLAVSGGKDSVVLADVLGRLSRRLRHVSFVGVTIDEGIHTASGDYRAEAISLAGSVLGRYGIEHRVYTYRELFGATLPEFVGAGVYSGSACSVCGVLRRRALNVAARELGATKIATGHNKDDEAQTVLMNVLRGDLERMIRLGAAEGGASSGGVGGFVPRVKPLKRLFEREIAMYAYLRGYGFQSVECPFSRDTVRDAVREALELLSTRVSGVHDALLNFEDKLVGRLGSTSMHVKPCRNCGEPTSPGRELCKACEYVLKYVGGRSAGAG